MRICLLGAECTGKSTLAADLADALNAVRVPEFLRDFVDARGRVPRQDEQLQVLQAQILRESDATAQALREGRAGVVCDTAPLLTAVYSAHYFGDTSLLPVALAHHHQYTHTLLLEPDLPWRADGLQRDSAAARDAVHQRLCATLEEAGIAVVRVAGPPAQRLQAALVALTR